MRPGNGEDQIRGGRSPQGERGLKSRSGSRSDSYPRRSPQGERGLKLGDNEQIIVPHGRSPQGERGLKFLGSRAGSLDIGGRSPQGERGLKSPYRRAVWMPPRVALRKESVD